MKISIAMATYNGATYLQEQLDSFCRQTLQPDELIVCDDGSTDATLEILEAFQKIATFNVVFVKNDKRLGYTKNFSKAISLCTGDIIFFSDQDDVWFPEKIDVVTRMFLQHPEFLLLIHDGNLVDENLVWHGATKLGQVRAGWGATDSFVTGALTAIHRKIVPYILPIPDEIVGHDGWIHRIGLILNLRLVLDAPLQLIRRHSTNTSAWIASSVKKIDKQAVFLESFRTPHAASYKDRERLILALILRVENIRQKLDKNLPPNLIKSILVDLFAEREAIKSRNKIFLRGFIGRKFLALNMLLHGQYKYFNGFKSFFRDVLR